MRRRRHLGSPSLASALTAAALVALTACSPGGGAGGGSGGGDGGSGDGSALADCLEGVWALDTDALVSQLADFMGENGLVIADASSDGTVTLSLEDGQAIYDSDVTYTLVANFGDLPVTIAQTQSGQSSGSWTVDGGEVLYDGWVAGIEFDTQVSMDGEAANLPIEIPDTTGGGVATATTCEGDTLQTLPEGSPFTSTWSRVG